VRQRSGVPDGQPAPPGSPRDRAADRRRRQKAETAVSSRRQRDPLWARLLVMGGALLMVASGVTIVAEKVLVARYTGTIRQETLIAGDTLAHDSRGHASINGPINLLLVGVDERADDPAAGARSDTNIIVHIPASHDAAYLVSVPRDTKVSIPAYRKTGYGGGTDKLNAAFQFGYQNGGGRAGGFDLLAKTIKQMSGISFNGGAIVNFDGFQALVKTLGGVDMCIDEKVTSIHVGQDRRGQPARPYWLDAALTPHPVPGVTPQVYQPGCRHLEAWQALDYVRQRELVPDGDYGRQRHQQQFIKAVVKETISKGVITNPAKLDTVVRSAGKLLTFDGGGAVIEDWIFALKGIGGSGMTMIKTNGGNFNSTTINGQSFETLNDTTVQLLQAVRDDNVPAFVAAHPDWVAGDTQTPTPAAAG
jgi:LCP family protein required for cell wall assembly